MAKITGSGGGGGGGDYHLSNEILSVIPTDPYEQLELGRKITSLAIASCVSKLESESSLLRRQLDDKDRVASDLRDEISRLDRILAETDVRLSVALEENAKLTEERDSMSLATKKLARDFAKRFRTSNPLAASPNQSGFGMKGGKSKAEASTKSSSRLAVKMGSDKGSTRPAKKTKFEKDPNKPKRPPSAFFVFMEEFREQYKKNNLNLRLHVTVIIQAGAAKWKIMSDADKAPFMAKASKLMAEYDKTMSFYNNKKKQAGGWSNDAEMEEGSDKSKYEVNDDDDEDDDEDSEEEEEEDD